MKIIVGKNYPKSISEQKNKAHEHLEWILEAPLNKKPEIEDEGYKLDAEEFSEKHYPDIALDQTNIANLFSRLEELKTKI